MVRSRRCERQRSPPRLAKPVPPELEGLCFNCLSCSHIKAECRSAPRCYNCWCEGHHASSYRLPLRQGLHAMLGAKRGRSPSAQMQGRRVLPRRVRMHSHGSAETVSQASGSTGRSTLVPRRCAPPTPSPPPPPPPPPPHAGDVAAPDMPNAVELPAHALVVPDWEDAPPSLANPCRPPIHRAAARRGGPEEGTSRHRGGHQAGGFHGHGL